VRKFVPDTNLYVRAFRDQDGARELESFYLEFTSNMHLSSVVLHELLVGASPPAKARPITEDPSDFEMISRYLKHDHVPPWPLR
jgi:hypothetical protein